MPYFHPVFLVTFFLLLLPPQQPLRIMPCAKNKTKTPAAHCYRMPQVWQTTDRASLRDFSSSLKTFEVPIPQALHLHRKPRLGRRFCPAVTVFKAVLCSHTADSPPAKGLGQGTGHRHSLPSTPGQDGTTRAKPAPSSTSPSSARFSPLHHQRVSPVLTNNSFYIL